MIGSLSRSAVSLLAVGSLLASSGVHAEVTPPTPATPVMDDSLEPLPTAAAPNCVARWVIDATGIHRLADRCPSTEGEPSAASASLRASIEQLTASAPATEATAEHGAADAACDVPYYVDAGGVQRLIPQCLLGSSAPNASTASAGPVPARSAPISSGPACTPPYYLDKAGIRRLRPECL